MYRFEIGTARCEMLGHLVPQEAAQAGGLGGQLLGGTRRLGFPEEEVVEEFEERLGGRRALPADSISPSH